MLYTRPASPTPQSALLHARFAAFYGGYQDAALATTTDAADVPLNETPLWFELPNAVAMELDAWRFFGAQHARWSEAGDRQAGVDLWLERSGNGGGFSESPELYGPDAATLTLAAQAAGPCGVHAEGDHLVWQVAA